MRKSLAIPATKAAYLPALPNDVLAATIISLQQASLATMWLRKPNVKAVTPLENGQLRASITPALPKPAHHATMA